MKGVSRKGVSPIVASVLMVMLVMVLAVIIFLWARGFISEQVEKFGASIEDSCEKINFDVVRYGNELEVSNRGNIDIYSLDIKLISGGDSNLRAFPKAIDSGGSVNGFVNMDMDDGTVAKEIVVYPVLVGNVRGKNNNNIFTCLDAGIKVL